MVSLKSELKGKIGLEIHVYVITKEKLFCSCFASRERGLKSNTNICPICTGQPGAKPLLPNGNAIDKAVQVGLMLGCTINNKLDWQRKHYSWPDLPKGYQNTLSGSHATPIGANGNFQGIGISSMHLEEDPASWNPETGEVDYNRSGLPLIEIVTEPNFSNSEEVVLWLKKLLHNLSYLKAADTNAGIKVDVNVSIPGKSERVEIKNINSLESIQRAIDYEIGRQNKEGGKIRETRRFDDSKGITMVMRTKEGQADYRFISDPDLVSINIDDKFISNCKEALPETPEVKLEKMINKYKIGSENAEILTKHLDIAEFFEAVTEKIDANFALPWITVELLRLLNDHKKTLNEVDIKVEHFVELLKKVKCNLITPLQCKHYIKQFYPKSFVIDVSEQKITNDSEILILVNQAIQSNKKAVENYKAGEKKAFDFLMGEIMKLSNKRADYKVARALLEKSLR